MCANKLDLRKEPSDKHTIDLGDGIVGFKFHNVTKYYENDIVFISHESKHINLVPVELLDRVEGVIVYFDSDNVSTFILLDPKGSEIIEHLNSNKLIS